MRFLVKLFSVIFLGFSLKQSSVNVLACKLICKLSLMVLMADIWHHSLHSRHTIDLVFLSFTSATFV